MERWKVELRYDYMKGGWVSWLVDQEAEFATHIVTMIPSTQGGPESVWAKAIACGWAHIVRESL